MAENTPPRRSDDDERNEAIEASRSGDAPIFIEEDASPDLADTRHALLGTTCFEVSPEQLIDVAKHIAARDEDHRDTIRRAYGLICEAHLASRNLKHWNEKVRRDHFSETVSSLVDSHPVEDNGTLRRKDLVHKFLHAWGKNLNSTDADKLWNKWFVDTLRLRSFRATIPHDPRCEDFDHALHGTLVEHGWLRQLHLPKGSPLILPEATKPSTPAPRNAKEGDHETRPWWETGDTWWPVPSKAEIDEEKRRYLNNRFSHFLSPRHAKEALDRFGKWLEIERAKTRDRKQQNQENGSPAANASTPRSADSGQFVPKSTKGAARNLEGKFRRAT